MLEFLIAFATGASHDLNHRSASPHDRDPPWSRPYGSVSIHWGKARLHHGGCQSVRGGWRDRRDVWGGILLISLVGRNCIDRKGLMVDNSENLHRFLLWYSSVEVYHCSYNCVVSFDSQYAWTATKINIFDCCFEFSRFKENSTLLQRYSSFSSGRGCGRNVSFVSWLLKKDYSSVKQLVAAHV